jgi:GH15 family glucan-1,4-alpha-glucosidase
VVAAVALAAAGLGTIAARETPGVSALLLQGVAADPCTPGRVLAVPARLRARFEPDSSVVRVGDRVLTGHGVAPLDGALDRCVSAEAAASRGWLSSGLVPGTTASQRSLASRALLDLRLLVRPNGAVAAAWHGEWRYAWPRDSSWVVAALADTGHLAPALQVLRFLAQVQNRDGSWAARYWLSGRPVDDGRPAELDATGWVPWAVWSWARAAQRSDPLAARRELARLWPMVTRAANAAVASLTRDGLPGTAMDYWESPVQVTLGTAAPLLAGLRAAADLAGQLAADDRGQDGQAGQAGQAARDGRRWAAAATRLDTAITRTFGRSGYLRTPSPDSGADAAVTVLGPPLATPDEKVLRAERHAQAALRMPSAGLAPGEEWTGSPAVAWTAETAFFALFDAGTGRQDDTTRLLSWLAAHRTRLGELAEQVDPDGEPVAVAPLAWSDAVVLLTMLAERHELAAVPPPGAPG